MSRRTSIVLFPLIWLGLLAACAPDVHVHIYLDGTGTDGGMQTDGATEGGGGTADGPSSQSGQSASADDGPPATSDNPGTGADDASSDTGSGVDSYPQPVGGECPEGTRYSQVSPGFEFCAPPCDGGSCPSPLSGDAPGQCVFNPDSTNTMCEVDDGTCLGEETCTTIPGGGLGCALAPSHCALVCSGGQACAEGMECTTVGACQFPGG